MIAQPKPRIIFLKKILILISVSFNLVFVAFLLNFAYKTGYLGRGLVLVNANQVELPTDTLSSQSWWQEEVRYQVIVSKNSQYNYCLFGDSISSELGNTIGDRTFNFAEPGMSTISLIEQLKALTTANVKCRKVILAIGTNDADYRTMNDQFVKNTKQIISTVKQMGAEQIVLIPAFYSTVAASHDVTMAGTIERVDEINTLIRQIAATEKVMISEVGMSLYEGKALKENLTIDGVHLNTDGRKIYRDALLKIQSELP